MSGTSIPSGLPFPLPLSDLPTSGGLSIDTTYGAYLLGTFVSLPFVYGYFMRFYKADTATECMG